MAQGKLGLVDPCSYSNSDKVLVSDIHLFLSVDFAENTLNGRAELTCRRVIAFPDVLILDSRDLIIRKVTSEDGESLKFTLSHPYKTFGSSLTIDIPKGELDTSFKINVEYQTSPDAAGLQWLTPEQTQGKKEPFLFSQFQAILARSAVPCQDTPAVKFRYKADISAPEQLTVLMSALHDGEPTSIAGNRKLAKFTQPIPIPSYLIAIAVGRIDARRLSPRITVRAEPETIEASAYEFAEAEAILATAEKLCGRYEWGVYDLLVMPPSFPFGGMENPCLTFVTPTLLAGDRSLVDVVAHEMSHSWSGNLVTNKTFEHFWLNEGWTRFIEMKIKGMLHGSAERHFQATLGLNHLKEEVEKTLGVDSEFTKLVPNLKDTDPDDAFSAVPYEKGHTFIFYLEQLVGGADVFDLFIKNYFANFRNKSITTDEFKKYFLKYFSENEEVKKIDWDQWLYSKGMPPIEPEYDPALSNACKELALSWKAGSAGRSAKDIISLSSPQIILFLSHLLESQPLSADDVRRMGELYSLQESKNSEIRFRWLRIGLKAKALEFVPKALAFVNEQGRMKFVRPIYRDLYDWDEVRQQAIDNYHKFKNGMMFVLSNQLLKDLHIAN